MSAPFSVLAANDPSKALARKKRVLLLDGCQAKRDLRSETMRKLGIEVDCAADVSEARCWWRPDLYNLVLIHLEDSPRALDKFCNDLQTATPPQQIMFLTGRPGYLSSSPVPGPPPDEEEKANPVPGKETVANGKLQRWGILEACQRISAIRSLCDARARAIRDRPEPRRDSETSRPSRSVDVAITEFIREEPQ